MAFSRCVSLGRAGFTYPGGRSAPATGYALWHWPCRIGGGPEVSRSGPEKPPKRPSKDRRGRLLSRNMLAYRKLCRGSIRLGVSCAGDYSSGPCHSQDSVSSVTG